MDKVGNVLKWGGVSIDASGSSYDTDVTALLESYSPQFVLFPEGDPSADHLPYDPRGKHDFHPRPVDFFIETVWLIPLYAATLPRYLHHSISSAGLALVIIETLWFVFGVSNHAPTDLVLGFAAVWALGLMALSSTQGLSLWYEELRTAKKGHLRHIRDTVAQRPLGIDDYVFKPSVWPWQTHEVAAWRRYCALAPSFPGDRCVYLHIRRDDGPYRISLQFWLFYYFNDFWNKHDSDWECVTLFFRDERDRIPPTAVAYSAHIGAELRHEGTWTDVDGHPLVYVAKGSHANYFAPNADGYPIPDNRWARRDVVPYVDAADLGLLASHPYEVVVLPDDVTSVDPRKDETLWRRLWWLAYRGRWGSQGRAGWYSAFRGPAHKGAIWDHPSDWAQQASTEAIGRPLHLLDQLLSFLPRVPVAYLLGALIVGLGAWALHH